MSSAAAEEAIERAKAIAARLSGDNSTQQQQQVPAAATTTANSSSTQHAHDVAEAAQAALASALGGGGSVAATADDAADGSSKRKRWGTSDGGDNNAPSTTAAATETLPGLEDAAKRFKANNEPVKRRVWVSTTNKPASHFMIYLSQGDKLKELASRLHPDLKIELKGRGSSRNPPVPGMPEEPLHVLLEGDANIMANAETMVEDLLRQAETAALEALPTAASASSETTNAASNAANSVVLPNSTATASTSATPAYTPVPVAALIHGNAAAAVGGQLLEEQIGVPNGVVGYIIGRGGENITSMQARSGCKVQIQKEHEIQPGQTQRVITLTAASKEAIDMCRGLIESMVAERIRTTNSSATMSSAMATPGGAVGAGAGTPATSTQAQKVQEALSAGHSLVTVTVPDSDVGLIIGRGGATIRSIQDRSGANIQIPQQADADNPMSRTVSITHPHVEGANVAKQMIEEMLATKAQQNQTGPYTTIQVAIPDKDVGMCIGRSGCVIREMQNKTNTKIQIPPQSMPGQEYRYAEVSGPAEGCNQVKQMIERIVLEQSSQSVMSGAAYQGGGGGGGYGQQYGAGSYGQHYGGQQYGDQQQYGAYGQQQQAQAGQQDYSAEWAAYYAAQAANGSAGGAAANQTAAASAPAAAATAAPAASAPASSDGQPAADAYYEQFFRYAYYYGEPAARQYYGAWSPPAGTPNPYGENPAGIAPAPAADAATAQQPAPAPAAAQPAPAATTTTAASDESAVRPRETSQRRGVSNLPAWMTKGKT